MKREYKAGVFLDLLFILIQTICIVGLFTENSFDYMRMAIGNLIFWLIYILLEYKNKWKIPLYVRLVTIISILSNDIMGDFLNLYVSSVLFDRLQHVFGTYALTLWSFYVIQQFIKTKFKQKKFVIIFMLSLSVTLGTFYEMVEFLLDEFTHPAVKNQPSLLDTNLDLFSDLTGGILALVHYFFSTSLKSFTFPFEK
jgi:uncharacterized membrane protein YjdF